MQDFKDDGAYPNDVPLELEVSQSNEVQPSISLEKQPPSPEDDSRESQMQRNSRLQNELLRFLVMREQQSTRKKPQDGLSYSAEQARRAAKDEVTTPSDDDSHTQQDSDEDLESDTVSEDDLSDTDTTDLPRVPGPKLARFRPLADPLDISFEEVLHKGHYSHVWKVSCRGYTYALKIFKPGAWSDLLEKWNSDDCPLPQGWTRESLKPYTDPFFNECRVYGRLKETNKENLAMDCHGYVMFSSAYLEGQGVDLGFTTTSDPSSARGSEPGIIHEGMPEEPVGHGSELVYALLKDLPPTGAISVRPTESEVKQMSKDLLTLHKLGIFHASISHSSYVAGKLVDLGTAQTVPSPWLDGYYRGMNPVRIGKDPAFSDQVDFDEKVIDYWNDQPKTIAPEPQTEMGGKNSKTRQRRVKDLARVFTPEQKTYRKLRSGKDRQFLVNLRLGEGWFDPSKYKWAGADAENSELENNHTKKRTWSNDTPIVDEQANSTPQNQIQAKKRKFGRGGVKT
ncbi:hypothetical protein PFICI_14517 [Pestalotiopsis fici W106-1]|uniref:Uncharacterized protein n=1 Tax=Pestalotiopsis fici (strain W106-1 / CGMCC3.15140) TaxID=1229662 RepID=W3WL82_PESFW|nr:uncharacterized protein PFICI_14517 [Pestalotiopsis fici W106-1]ETS73571.1 hypothetical protein PFICI_14517 [Pestalotiopsis fici W106-1]